MKLYKLEASNWETFFGKCEEGRPISESDTLIDRDVTIIAQKPWCDAFLLLSNLIM